MEEAFITMRSESTSQIVHQALAKFVESNKCDVPDSLGQQRYCCMRERILDINAEPGQ